MWSAQRYQIGNEQADSDFKKVFEGSAAPDAVHRKAQFHPNEMSRIGVLTA
jgi:hypothetical protein